MALAAGTRGPSRLRIPARSSLPAPLRLPTRRVLVRSLHEEATASERAAPPHVPSSDPTAHAAALCRVLGVAAPRLMALAARCPPLFAFSPEALELSVAALADVTGLKAVQIPQLLAADPYLLLMPYRLRDNMRALQEGLGASADAVRGAAAREPSVLALRRGQVERRLGGLAALLQTDGAGAAAAALGYPGLLAESSRDLQRRMRDLEHQLNVVDAPAATPQPIRTQSLPASPSQPSVSQLDAATALTPRQPQSQPPPQQQQHDGRQPQLCMPEPEPEPKPGLGPGPHNLCVHTEGSSIRRSQTPQQQPEQPPEPQQQPEPQQPEQQPEPHAPAPALRRALLAALVRAKPSLLLSTPPDAVAQRAHHLARRTGLALDRVLSAAAQGPNLLAASSPHVDRHCAAMAQALGPAGLGLLPSASVAVPASAPASATDASASAAPLGCASTRSASAMRDAAGEAAAARQATGRGGACRGGSAACSGSGSGGGSTSSTMGAGSQVHGGAGGGGGSNGVGDDAGEAAAAALLLACPQLLNLTVGTLLVNWGRLSHHAASHPAWAADLAAASHAQRGAMLAAPAARTLRLRYLAEAGRQAQVGLGEALGMPEDAFAARWPEFTAWIGGSTPVPSLAQLQAIGAATSQPRGL